MKKSLIFLMSAIVLMLASCSKKSEILATVPKNAKYCAIINLESIGKAVVTKGSNGEYEPVEPLKRLIDAEIKGSSPSGLESVEKAISLINIDEPCICFQYGYGSIITFMVRDARGWRDLLAEQNTSLSEVDGVWVIDNGKGYMIDDQVWLNSNAGNLSTDQIKAFTGIKEADSMASTPGFGDKTASGSACEFITSLSSGFSSQAMQLGLAMNMAFEDPEYLYGTIDFEKGRAEMILSVLNSKYKEAKTTLNMAPLDMGRLKSFPGRGNIFGALSIDPAQVQKLVSQFGTMAGLPADVQNALMALDGQLIFSANNFDEDEGDFSFALSLNFNNAEAAEFAGSFLDSFARAKRTNAEIDIKGNELYMHCGADIGETISDVSDNFKDAVLGIVVSTTPLFNAFSPELSKLVSEVSLNGKKRGDSLVLELTVDTEQGENALVSMLKLFAYSCLDQGEETYPFQ